MLINVKKLHPDATLPTYGTTGAACFDLSVVVRKAFTANPNMTINQLLPVVTQWLSTPVIEEVTMQNSDKEKSRAIKTEAWEQLPFDDLRYINSQHKNPSDMYAELKLKGMLLDLKSVLARAS